MPDNIGDVIRDRNRQALASSPTPTWQFQNLPTPAPQMTMDQYRQGMFGSINVGSLQAMGLAQAQSMNIGNPYGNNLGAAAGMAPAWMMTPSPYGVFRPGPATPPPALMATPGVTNAFTNPADLSVQYELMRTGMFADPGSAAQNYGRMRLHRFGQDFGAGIGTAMGVGASFIPGVGAMGGSLIGSLGQMAMENLNNIPGIGGALRWGIGAMNQNVAEQLAWTGGAQHGTLGRVALGPGEMGLGGRGMNTQSAMRLGRQLRQMQLETGRPDEAGSLTQSDMLNLTRAAGDYGFLESATSVDQIAKTVGGLMKLVGGLAKITGDPDFRNNLRELGRMRDIGFTTQQGVETLQSANSWARMAGMTRQQIMEQGAAPGMQRAVAAGLTPAVGYQAGMYGKGQERMLRGLFTETQQALFGDMGQTLAEGQIGFAAGVAPYIIPSLLSAKGGGEIGLDREKIQKLLKGGPLDMMKVTGEGAINVQQVAQQAAEQVAKMEGREVRAGEVPDMMLKMQAQMREFQSDFYNILKPQQMEFLRYQTFQGLKQQGMEEFGAALQVAGGREDEAQMLLKQWKSPGYGKRITAWQGQEQERITTERYQEAQQRLGEMEETREVANSFWRRNWRAFKQWYQEPMTMSARDFEKADEEISRIQREGDEAKGITRMPTVGVPTLYSDRVVKMVQKAVKEGKWKTRGPVRNRRTGDQPLSEEEARAYGQLRGMDPEGNVLPWLVGDEQEGTARIETLGGTLRQWALHPWQTATTSTEEDRYLQSHYKMMTKNIRKELADADKMSDLITRSSDATGEQMIAVAQDVARGLEGMPGQKPPAQMMAAIRSEVMGQVSRAGKGGLGATAEDIRNYATNALARYTGSNWGVARAKIDSMGDRFDTWAMTQIMHGPDKNAIKAVEHAMYTAMGIKPFNIPKTEEERVAQQKAVAKRLGEAGVFERKASTDPYAAEAHEFDLQPAEFGAAERGAFETLKSVEELGEGLGGDAETGQAKAKALALVVARAKQEDEDIKAGRLDPTQRAAGGVLQELRDSGDAQTLDVISKIEKKFEGMSKEQLSTLSRIAEVHAPGFKGSGKDVVAQIMESERLGTSQADSAPQALRDIYEMATLATAPTEGQPGEPAKTPADKKKEAASAKDLASAAEALNTGAERWDKVAGKIDTTLNDIHKKLEALG